MPKDNFFFFYSQQTKSLAAKLIAEGEWITRGTGDTRTGVRRSIISDVEIPTLTSDEIEGNSPQVGSMIGAANLVDTDIVDWGGFNVTAEYMGAATYLIPFPGGGSAAKESTFADVSLNRWSRCQARIISGTPAGLASDYMGFRTNAGAVVGTPFALEDLTDEWQEVDFSVTSGSASQRVTIRCTQEVWLQVRYVRAVDTLLGPPAAFEFDSADGAAYANDVSDKTPSWASEGTLIGIVPDTYGWSTTHTVSQFARYFETNAFWLFGIDQIQLQGTTGTPNIGTGAPVYSNFPFVYAVDYDGVNAGLRYNAVARVQQAKTEIPSGPMYVGNRGSGDRPLCARQSILYIPRKITDTEYSALRDYLTNTTQPRSVYTAAKVIAWWGDSMTDGGIGGGEPRTALADALNTPVYNGGVGGETSTQIETRMLADSVFNNAPNTTLICAGHNNYTQTATVLSDIADMVAHLNTDDISQKRHTSRNWRGRLCFLPYRCHTLEHYWKCLVEPVAS